VRQVGQLPRINAFCVFFSYVRLSTI